MHVVIARLAARYYEAVRHAPPWRAAHESEKKRAQCYVFLVRSAKKGGSARVTNSEWEREEKEGARTIRKRRRA